MFGEHPSESPKAPSPWSISSSHTPRPSTASSSTLSQSHSSSYLVNALARSLSLSQTSSDHQLSTSFSSSSRSLSTPSNPTSSSDSPSDSAEGEELFGFLDDLGTTTSRSGSGVSSGPDCGGGGEGSSVEERFGGKEMLAGGSLRRISAEVDEKGNIEYKLQLSAPTHNRFQRLVTQLKWRLLEGGGEAIYEIGVLDDGTLVGLNRPELLASLRTLERMADELGATVIVLKEIRLDPVGEDTGKRGKWERWKAQVAELKEKEKGQQQQKQQVFGDFEVRKANRSAIINKRVPPSHSPYPNATSIFNPSSSQTASIPTLPPYKDDRDSFERSLTSTSPTSIAYPPAEDPLSLSLPRFADRSLRKKKPADLLDPNSNDRQRRHGHQQPSKKWKNHRPPVSRLTNGNEEEETREDEGIFSVFDLDLNVACSSSSSSSPLSTATALPASSSAPPLPAMSARPTATNKPISAKKLKEDQRAERKRQKKRAQMDKDVRAVSSFGADGGFGDEEDEGGWAGQSLDVWGETPSVAVELPPIRPSSPPGTPIPLSMTQLPVSIPPSSSTSTVGPSTNLTDPSSSSFSTSLPLSESATPSPSPLLSPIYRPSSLLSTTPRAAFPPQQVPLRPAAADEQKREEEDGHERICVEALVVRKEMEGHLNFEDVSKWMQGA